jgi:outer membrane receptor for ferrienterochelin and colicin
MGYSFYQTTQTQPEQIVPGVSTVNSGVPAHKLTLQGNLRMGQHFSVNPTIMYVTNKFSIKNPVTAPNESREYPEELHINLYLQYSNLLIRNLNLGAGCINLLDGQFWFAPWKRDFSSAVSLPFQGREFYLRLSYNIKS